MGRAAAAGWAPPTTAAGSRLAVANIHVPARGTTHLMFAPPRLHRAAGEANAVDGARRRRCRSLSAPRRVSPSPCRRPVSPR